MLSSCLPALTPAGSAISSGLFVPMLMLGAVIGRFIGLATVDIAQSAGKSWSPGGLNADVCIVVFPVAAFQAVQRLLMHLLAHHTTAQMQMHCRHTCVVLSPAC
jgi:H+/Cl- antiporter ClcA